MNIKIIYKIIYSYETGTPKNPHRLVKESNWVLSKEKMIDALQERYSNPKREFKIEEIQEDILQYDIVLI